MATRRARVAGECETYALFKRFPSIRCPRAGALLRALRCRFGLLRRKLGGRRWPRWWTELSRWAGGVRRRDL